MNKDFFSVKNLSGGIGKEEIIKDISFTVPIGITGIIGKNGAGKTTLIKTILNPVYRKNGEIFLFQNNEKTDLTRLSHRERAKLLAYSPQEMKTAFSCTVRDFVIMGRAPYLKGLETPSKNDGILADNAMSELGILHLRDRYTDTLSGGEKRLCYLARARVQGAKIMLLDEPVSGLDFSRQYLFFEYLTDFVKNSGTGALVSIHDPSQAYRFCDSIIVMNNGRLSTALNKEQEDFDEKYLEILKSIYGEKTDYAVTEKGKFIIWAGDSYDKD